MLRLADILHICKHVINKVSPVLHRLVDIIYGLATFLHAILKYDALVKVGGGDFLALQVLVLEKVDDVLVLMVLFLETVE